MHVIVAVNGDVFPQSNTEGARLIGGNTLNIQFRLLRKQQKKRYYMAGAN